ncbi:unnamed protein product [Durusdinium trenchii]|uniref:Uncharacterized protein n=1 Tax=Durusdinium trenchii TaxID=1381693 RepID=A0ABP0SKV4_9DINO
MQSLQAQNPGSDAGLHLSLARILGPEKLNQLEKLQGASDYALEEAKHLVFGQVREIVESLQAQLRESEPLVADLQEKADSLEEKRVLLERKVARAERDRDIAERDCADMEAKVKQFREEGAPVIARFMEAEVLRTQIQACSEDLVRLQQDLAACKQELEEGLPKLSEFEDDEAECAGAIAQLEASHTEEVALLKALHTEELEELRCGHALKVAELERSKAEQIDELKRVGTEEIDQLRSALGAARWQADVYVREHQDAVREICLRQRENARLAKKHGEARQEALELAVRLEALRAAEAGAPAREAELQAVRQRYVLLQQTAAEWREALVRKQGDCEVWRRRAESKGVPTRREDMELQAEIRSVTSSPGSHLGKAVGYRAEGSGNKMAARFASPFTDKSEFSEGARQIRPWSDVSTIKTPTRMPLESRQRQGRSVESARMLSTWSRPGAISLSTPSSHPAGEFVNVVLKAAKLRVEAETAAREGYVKPRERTIIEAEHEVEMLAFLMEENDSSEAEVLLEMEAQVHETSSPAVAARLRAQISELQCRRPRSLSPPELTA